MADNRPKVHLLGKDGAGWALDEEYRLTRKTLEPFVDLVDFNSSEIVHAIWWEGLAFMPRARLVGKRIVCQLENPPFYWIKQTSFRTALRTVGLWVAQSHQAADQLTELQAHWCYCPYKVDTEVFNPIASSAESRRNLRRSLGLPQDRYLIGNFHRDTEGRDLMSPKAQKGPDIFLEILRALYLQGLPIHVVLAGPRRFWIRRQLELEGIPYTFIGKDIQGRDDYPQNILNRKKLNELYNALDLYLVTSRWEGGPHAIMEAAAAKCKVLSTPVGLAADILNPECIYDDLEKAVEVLRQDISGGLLDKTIEGQFRRVLSGHQVSNAVDAFKALYAELKRVQPFRQDDLRDDRDAQATMARPSVIDRLLKKVNIINVASLRSGLTIGIWHKFFRPPYGGGNQFMLALKGALKRRGVHVLDNALAANIDVYICNSAWFDKEKFIAHSRKYKIRMIHRIDGPISLYRGKDRHLDDEIFELNERFASVTVIQSLWTLQKLIEMRYKPVDPLVIGNAADSAFFYALDKKQALSDRKVRLISTSWSDNPRKGGAVYEWIEENLDWGRFEYTFVGRCSEKLSKVKHIPPVSSRELGELLRAHDIYITASQNDPCSNALIEAQSCGLPALYLDSGGHREIVGFGGRPFLRNEDIFSQLEAIVRNWEAYRRMIRVWSIEEIAEKYLEIAKAVAVR